MKTNLGHMCFLPWNGMQKKDKELEKWEVEGKAFVRGSAAEADTSGQTLLRAGTFGRDYQGRFGG